MQLPHSMVVNRSWNAMHVRWVLSWWRISTDKVKCACVQNKRWHQPVLIWSGSVLPFLLYMHAYSLVANNITQKLYTMLLLCCVGQTRWARGHNIEIFIHSYVFLIHWIKVMMKPSACTFNKIHMREGMATIYSYFVCFLWKVITWLLLDPLRDCVLDSQPKGCNCWFKSPGIIIHWLKRNTHWPISPSPSASYESSSADIKT